METILKMYKHLDWANKRILEQLEKMDPDNPGIIRLFSHILLAEQVWYARIKGEDTSMLQVWSDGNLDECKEMINRNEERYSHLLKNLSITDLDQIISYQNTLGKQFENSIGDILTHVALHGQHHRGQINQRLRESGIAPISIDFISMVR